VKAQRNNEMQLPSHCFGHGNIRGIVHLKRNDMRNS